MIDVYLKSELANKTNSLISKARINDNIIVTDVIQSIAPDSVTVEVVLPENITVTKIELLGSDDQLLTTIPGLNINTAIATIFQHNIQFVQGGV